MKGLCVQIFVGFNYCKPLEKLLRLEVRISITNFSKSYLVGAFTLAIGSTIVITMQRNGSNNDPHNRDILINRKCDWTLKLIFT